MTEKEFEDILARYPGLIEEGMVLEGRQVAVGRRRIDLLFRDRFGQKLIVELKKGTILREHIGQLFEYEGDLLNPDDPTIRVMLIGNRVPPNMRRALEHHGFEWREFTIGSLTCYLTEQGDTEYLACVSQETEAPVSAPQQPVADGITRIIHVERKSPTPRHFLVG